MEMGDRDILFLEMGDIDFLIFGDEIKSASKIICNKCKICILKVWLDNEHTVHTHTCITVNKDRSTRMYIARSPQSVIKW